MTAYMELESKPPAAAVEGQEKHSEIQHGNGRYSVAKIVGDGDAVAEKKEEPTYPPLRTRLVVMAALYLAMFLVSLVSLRWCP